MMRNSLIAAASSLALVLATTGCATTPPSGTAPVTGQSNIAQIAAQALAICQGACGVIANAATAGDIQALVTAYLSAGAFVTANIIATAVCDVIKAAKPKLSLRASGGQVVTVHAPNGQDIPIHFSHIR
jgi:hypothetical protein